MNRIRKVLLAVTSLVGASIRVGAADVVYTPENTPEDKSDIEVSGHAEMVGVNAMRHLWAWYRFDDAENLFVNDVSGGPSLRPATVGTTDECSPIRFKDIEPGYRGSACQFYGSNNQALKLKTSELPDCICSGSGEFTISGWFKVDLSCTNAYVAIYYIGNLTNANDKAQLRLLSNGSSPGSYVFDRGGSSSYWSDCWGAYGDWVNWTVVRKQTANEVIYNAYTNGISLYMKPHTAGSVGKDLVSDDEGLLIGGALSGASKRFLRSGNSVDEVLIFDKALSDDEVAWVAEHTKPYEFSAGWTLGGDASLDIYGSLGHMIRGYGAVNAETGLSLTNDADAYFGGTIAANAGLTFDPSTTTATQTLSGVSTYSGRTVVKGGTLLIQPQAKVPDALKNGLVGYWTFDDPDDPGHDLSGWGNKLTPSSAESFDAPVASEVPGGGRMMRYDFAGQATTARTTWRTATTVNGIDNTQTDYGCSLTMAVWARLSPGWAEENYRSGVAGFSASPGPGIGFNNKASPVTAITFGNRDVNAAGTCSAPTGKVLEDAFHLYVLTYDVSLIDTDDSNKVASFYLDGEFVAGKASYNSANKKKAGSGAFEVGGSIYGTVNSFPGVVDQAMLFNRALSAAEVAQLQAFGQHPAPTEATGVLPATTVLEVRSGATAAFENANETVAGLSGAGAVELTARAKLTVTETVGFTGAVTGAGKLALGANLKWETPVDEKGCALAGKYTYFTVPAAMLDEYSTEKWTTAAPLRRGGEFHVFAIESGGDVTFRATVTNPGLMILFR